MEQKREKKMTKTKFQFRGKAFYVDNVIERVMTILSSPGKREEWNEEVEKEKIKFPAPKYEENVHDKDFVENTLKRWESIVKIRASTSLINRAFNIVMQAGITHNPFAPDAFDAINEEVIVKTLDKIRSTRKSNVYKNYQASKKF